MHTGKMDDSRQSWKKSNTEKSNNKPKKSPKKTQHKNWNKQKEMLYGE